MWELTGNIFQDRYIPSTLVLNPTTGNDKKSLGLTMGAHALKKKNICSLPWTSMSLVKAAPDIDSGPSWTTLAIFLLYPVCDVNTQMASFSISSSSSCVKKH
eukprot:14889533-Ditylum_brightwellii.AAC.1